MTVITVRLSEKEKAQLEKYGKISDIVRDALHMYINNKQAREAVKRLAEYQKRNPVATGAQEITSIVREDRDSR
jgi:hypothetical protein